jgi:hypothetical protein
VRTIAAAIRDCGNDLDATARAIVDTAYEQGSTDNLTVQIVRVDELPHSEANEIFGPVSELPPPPLLEARMIVDGYRNRRSTYAATPRI